MVKHLKSEMRLEDFFFFVTHFIVRNKIDLVINRVKEIGYFFNSIGSKIIIAVQKEQIFSLCMLYSEISCCGKSLIFFGKYFNKIIFLAIFKANIPTVVGRAVIYNKNLHL